MATTVAMPKLGVEMEVARLIEWTVEEGEQVEEGAVIANLETEKVVYELPAPASGRLHLVATLDEEYSIGEVLAVLAATDDEYAEVRDGTPPAAAPASEPAPAAMPASPPAASAPAGSETERDAIARARRDGEPLASPVARRVAEAHGLILGAIDGSGPRGTIRRRDVERALAEQEVAPTPEAAGGNPSAAASSDGVRHEVVSMSAMRRTIASRLHASVQETAQMTDIREQDVSAVVEMRRSAIERADALGFRLSFTAIFAKAAVMALEAVPLLNSALVSEGELRRYEEVNLGMAVSIPDGLVVPVVRGAEQLSLRRLDSELKEVIGRARDRSASAADLSGGTFTLTNFGSYGSHMGTPILMPPQVGILGIGALVDRAVVRDGELAVGKSMYTSLTVDHRVIDGEAAGLYQNELARLFAEPDLLLYG